MICQDRINLTIDESFEIDPGNGERVRGRFRNTGRGPVGVYVHGLLSDGDGTKSMHLWESAIRQNRSWLRFDQRGQGRSDGTFDDFRISRVVEDLRCVLDHVGDRPTILVGSSLGGWIAAHAGLTGLHRIAAMVLIAPAINFVEGIWNSLSAEERSEWQSGGRRYFPSPYEDDGFALDFETVEDAREFDIYRGRVRYDCPVTVLHGACDDTVPVEVSANYQARTESEVRLDVIPGADHRLSGHCQTIQDCVDSMWPDD